MKDDWRRNGKVLSPHPATVVQRKAPHAATIGLPPRPPHPATVAQPHRSMSASDARSPHPALAPHPATVAQRSPVRSGPRAAQAAAAAFPTEPDDWMVPDSDAERLLIEKTVWKFGKEGVLLSNLAKFLNMDAKVLHARIYATTKQETAILAVALQGIPQKDRDIRLVHYYHLGYEKRYAGAMGPVSSSSNDDNKDNDDFGMGFEQYGTMSSKG
jgi:hypothetical protein